MKKLFNYILFILIIILTIYLYKNYKLFVVSSGSMEPTLKINELILIKKYSNYSEGDIISYYDKSLNMPVTHRIVRCDGDSFFTKGDYNNLEDKFAINNQEVIGKMIWHSYFLGSLYVHYKFAILLILFLVLLLINILLPPKERATHA